LFPHFHGFLPFNSWNPFFFCGLQNNINHGTLFYEDERENKWYFVAKIVLTYRVSHSKVNKVIWLCWGYRFWFLLIFFILHVHEIWPFMLNSSIFIFFMFRALYGSITQNLLFLNKVWIILTFSGLFQVIESSKPSKIYIFL
jgi:hypothetical protein